MTDEKLREIAKRHAREAVTPVGSRSRGSVDAAVLQNLVRAEEIIFYALKEADDARVVECPPDVLTAARAFATEFRREFRSAQAEHEGWAGYVDGFDATEPLDVAYLALVDALGAAESVLNVDQRRYATPRTDEQERSASSMATYPGKVVKASFARVLEAELQEATDSAPKMDVPAEFEAWLRAVDPCGEMSAGQRLIAKEAWDAARDAERYLPMGDNHHNAIACPYCNPKRLKFADSAPEVPRRDALWVGDELDKLAEDLDDASNGHQQPNDRS